MFLRDLEEKKQNGQATLDGGAACVGILLEVADRQNHTFLLSSFLWRVDRVEWIHFALTMPKINCEATLDNATRSDQWKQITHRVNLCRNTRRRMYNAAKINIDQQVARTAVEREAGRGPKS
jgi:hypothetical protein